MTHKEAPPETSTQTACREFWQKAQPHITRAWGRAKSGAFLAEESRLLHESWQAAQAHRENAHQADGVSDYLIEIACVAASKVDMQDSPALDWGQWTEYDRRDARNIMRAALTATIATAGHVSVPDGWDIRELDGGFVHVESPQGLAVNLGYLPEGNTTASQLLQLLACALLAASAETDGHG